MPHKPIFGFLAPGVLVETPPDPGSSLMGKAALGI